MHLCFMNVSAWWYSHNFLKRITKKTTIKVILSMNYFPYGEAKGWSQTFYNIMKSQFPNGVPSTYGLSKE